MFEPRYVAVQLMSQLQDFQTARPDEKALLTMLSCWYRHLEVWIKEKYSCAEVRK